MKQDDTRFWFLDRRRDVDVWTSTDYSWAAKLVISGKPIRLATADELSAEHLDHDLAVGPNGRSLCYWCRTEVPKRRRNWCSDGCVDDYKLNHDWATIRAFVFKRDCGICSSCGVDTEMARQWWRRIGRHFSEVFRAMDPHSCILPAGYWKVLPDAMKGAGWASRTHRDWWEADHVVARRDGGEDHPRNLRTMCLGCHRARTAEQRKAWKRKAA